MKTQSELVDCLRKEREHLRNHYHIVKIGIFGSFARNEATENSDIDLLVEFEENTPDLFDLKNDLRRYIRLKTGKKADIAREKYLKKYIKDSILAEAVYID